MIRGNTRRISAGVPRLEAVMDRTAKLALKRKPMCRSLQLIDLNEVAVSRARRITDANEVDAALLVGLKTVEDFARCVAGHVIFRGLFGSLPSNTISDNKRRKRYLF
jgi:hypothetical protein